jgi:putative acetyltransferase
MSCAELDDPAKKRVRAPLIRRADIRFPPAIQRLEPCMPGRTFEIREDDLSGEQTLALLRLHLAGMHANSPAGSVFALDLSGLKAPGVTVWTAWSDRAIAGIAALKHLGDGSGEIKSMRTHPDHLRQGVAAALLEHIIEAARARGMRRLSLETGSGPAFEPALLLYRRRGFVDGEAFADYRRSSFNQFLHLEL